MATKYWFGVEVDDEYTESVVRRFDCETEIPKEKRHITLLYVGTQIPFKQHLFDIGNVVKNHCFDVSFTVVDAFRGGTVVVRAIDPNSFGFVCLSNSLLSAAWHLGIEIKQDFVFKPHISLGRDSKADGYRGMLIEPPIKLRISKFGLYSSGHVLEREWELVDE